MAAITEQRDKIGDKDVKVDNSKFKIKSIGYAAENLELGSTKLEISPVENLGYLHGEVNTDKEIIEEQGVDAKGNSYNVKIETSNSMTAEWLQWGSNRMTPPNVRRGERVLLWQYAEEDKYYWSSIGMDDHLRRLETVTMAFSNTKDESTKKLTAENSYFLEVSTHEKLVTLKTNKSDGENFAYCIQINTKDGKVVITDDVNNFIVLESEEKRIHLENADASKIILDKKDCLIETADSIKLKTNKFNVESHQNMVKSTETRIESNFSVKGGAFNHNGVNVGSSHTHSGVRGGSDSTGGPK